ncbi:MAG: helix-turn-helix domain-containing protein [Gammaproteobacteria bacterium]|nr:helix-turn-helix domain-containing protein [Gammaproteobacteria bacterium]
MTAEKQLLKVTEVTKILNVSRTTLHRMTAAGKFPRAIELGPQARRWRVSDVQAWLDGTWRTPKSA